MRNVFKWERPEKRPENGKAILIAIYYEGDYQAHLIIYYDNLYRNDFSWGGFPVLAWSYLPAVDLTDLHIDWAD